MQKLSNANPENFDELKTELLEVVKNDLPETGTQQEILKAEADRVLEYAEQYVQQIKDQQIAAKKAEEEKKQKAEEMVKEAKKHLEELERLVVQAEAASKTAVEKLEPLKDVSGLKPEEILTLAAAVEQAGKNAITCCSTCADFIMSKKASIEQAEGMKQPCMEAIKVAQPRIQGATRMAAEALTKAKTDKESSWRLVAAKRTLKKKEVAFEKYDKDGDGFLNREEVTAYAKGEFEFEIPKENLDRIFSQMQVPGEAGIDLASFQLLKSSVGIARCEVAGVEKKKAKEEMWRKRREEMEQRINKVKEKKEEVNKMSEDVKTKLDKLVDDVAKAETSAAEVANQALTMNVDTLKEKALAIEASSKEFGLVITDVKASLQKIVLEVESWPELHEMRPYVAESCGRADAFDTRFKKASEMAANGKKLALHKQTAENEALRMDLAVKLRSHIEGPSVGKKVEDLFDVIVKNGNTKISTEDLKAYLTQNSLPFEPDRVDRCFANALIDEEEPTSEKTADEKPDEASSEKPADATTEKPADESAEKPADASAEKPADASVEKPSDDTSSKEKAKTTTDSLGKADFMRMVRVYYKAVKEIVLSDKLNIQQSSQIRRLEPQEVIEVFEGPVMDDSVNVFRVRGRAIRDGAIGWVTLAGNQGITFLMPGGSIFKVQRPVPLCEELKDVEGEKTVKSLEPGVALEVLEWARTSRSALGVTRIKAKIQGDTLKGWVTVQAADGTRFLEAA